MCRSYPPTLRAAPPVPQTSHCVSTRNPARFPVVMRRTADAKSTLSTALCSRTYVCATRLPAPSTGHQDHAQQPLVGISSEMLVYRTASTAGIVPLPPGLTPVSPVCKTANQLVDPTIGWFNNYTSQLDQCQESVRHCPVALVINITHSTRDVKLSLCVCW